MIDRDIMTEHRERIELHKQKYLHNDYYVKNESSQKSPFIFQSIIASFVFASLVIIKMSNSNFSIELTSSIDSLLKTDNLPTIINYVESFDQNTEGLVELNPIDSSENITPTEFTIDENMLSDINDSELNGKK